MPYLFVLCMEIMNQKIQLVVEQKEWKGIRASRGPVISHFLFADNIVLFCEASVQQAKLMERLLSKFCSYSGQKISTAKSKLFVSPNTPRHIARSLRRKFRIPLSSNLVKYLGLPILHGIVRVKTFSFVVEKVQKRLCGWKSRVLSKAAKLLLIQTTTFTIPYYSMKIMKFPVMIIEELERINKRFFWEEELRKRRLHTVACYEVCQLKKLGGLRLR